MNDGENAFGISFRIESTLNYRVNFEEKPDLYRRRAADLIEVIKYDSNVRSQLALGKLTPGVFVNNYVKPL